MARYFLCFVSAVSAMSVEQTPDASIEIFEDKSKILEESQSQDSSGNEDERKLTTKCGSKDNADDEFDNKLDYLYSALSNDLSLKQFSKVFSKISKQSAKEIYNKYKE